MNIESKIKTLQSSGEDYRELHAKAQQAKKALVPLPGSSVWMQWALVPKSTPDWLWTLSRKGMGNGPLDDWSLGFINDALAVIGADVRFDSNGKPTSQLVYYKTQLQSYTDDEKLMRWANSTDFRTAMVTKALNDGAGSLIGGARQAYFEERMQVFDKVFASVMSSELDPTAFIPDDPHYDQVTSDDGETAEPTYEETNGMGATSRYTGESDNS